MTYQEINEFFCDYTVNPIYDFDGFFSIQKKFGLEIVVDFTSDREVNVKNILFDIDQISKFYTYRAFKFNVLLTKKCISEECEAELHKSKHIINLIFF